MILQKKVQMERMTWPEVKEAIRESAGIAIVPVGAVEEHGPHLPTGTDSIETYEIGLQAAKKAGVVITPPVWFGNSRSFMDFPGTITVNPDSLKMYVRDIVLSLVQHGFNRPIILDGHGGNYGIFDILVEDIMLEQQVKVLHVRCWELATMPKPGSVPPYDGHGGSSETSAMLYLCPDDVDVDKFTDSKPEIELTKYGSVFPSPSGLYSKGPAVYPLMMGEMVKDGHHGDPKFGSAERGKDLLEVKINALVELLEALKRGEVKFLNG
ncbi:MAG: creatininase family protein [Anaerolineaceae bacterium]|nr:creatininase family protein [Anaerolineaceae bacterium]